MIRKGKELIQKIVQHKRNDPMPSKWSLDLKSMVKDPSNLWHLKYGHLGHDGLNLLSKKRMVDIFPNIVVSCDKYETCIFGKQDRLPFNSGNSRCENTQLNLVHYDAN